MTIDEIISAIEEFAPPELQEEYDNSGIITGNRYLHCSGVLIALDVTSAVIEEAVAANCNLIISHHPVIFRGIKTLSGKTYVEKLMIHAIKKDICLYAVHTNLDNVLMGVNGMIADKLTLTRTFILEPKKAILRRLITFAPTDNAEQMRQAIFKAGGGRIGRYSSCSFNSMGEGTFKAEAGADPYVGRIGELHHEKETKIEIVYPFYLESQIVDALVNSHPYEEPAYDIFTMDNVHYGIGAGIIGMLEKPLDEIDFLNLLKKTFNTGCIRHTAFRNKEVKRVAVCGGSGAFLIKTAIEKGADAYITSDIKYHEFFDAGELILLLDIGHYESEQFTVNLIHEILAKKFPTFAVLKTSVNTNPVKYFRGN